jgi:hypothetical protein
MHVKHLFTIPIYLKSLDAHAERQKSKKDTFVNESMSMKHHLKKEEYELQFDQLYWIPWHYTQIVGYIEIIISQFGDLKAYYWFVKAKRLSENLKDRTMEYSGKLFDVSKLDKPNDVIRSDINHFISILPKLRERFKDRYFDTESLELLLDSIDFKSIDYEFKKS